MEFFPPKKQTEEYLKSVFIEKGLAEVVKLHKAQTSNEAKRELQQVKNGQMFLFRVIALKERISFDDFCRRNSLEISIHISSARAI